MNKRDFLTTLALGLLGAAAPALAGESAPSPRRRRPKNWVAIPHGPVRTEDEWSALFERLHANAIEAVVVDCEGDELQTLLGVSRRHALEVHARLPFESPEGVLARLAEIADVPTLFGVQLHPMELPDGVTELVNGHLVPAARARGSLISAAVPAAAVSSWSSWKLDAFVVVPDEDAAEIATPITAALTAVAVPVYCGLRARSLEPTALAEASRTALTSGAAGLFLFDVESMDESRWTAFADAVAIS